MVDVADTAYLHVAAMTETDIKSERIFALSEVYNYNDILAASKKAKPDYELVSINFCTRPRTKISP
jgi:hypothetical protein